MQADRVAVTLTPSELWLSASAGMMRRLNGVKHQRSEPYGARPACSWDNDINGSIAEVALAKWFNVFWSGTVGRIDLPDVGIVQVRSKTDAQHRLVVLRSDDDNAPFVSVMVGIPVCYLCGWMFAGEAKRAEWLLPADAMPDRYFIPNAKLRRMAELKSRLNPAGVSR